MTEFFTALLIGLALCAWFGALVFCMYRAVDDSAFRWAVAGALVIVVPIAALVAFVGDDPHAHQLCLSGHEEWREEHNVKGGTHVYKAFICEQWQR